MNIGQLLQERWHANDKKSKLDAETLALSNQGLTELLMALGAKVPPINPENTHRERLLEAVEIALFRKP
jgi:hypothetical protein